MGAGGINGGAVGAEGVRGGVVGAEGTRGDWARQSDSAIVQKTSAESDFMSDPRARLEVDGFKST